MANQLIRQDWIAGLAGGELGQDACPMPGAMIRSRGTGRGLARGQGRGPIGRPAMRGFGAVATTAEPTLLDQVRAIYSAVVDLDPIIQIVANHPYLFVTGLMAAIYLGSATGAFTGAQAAIELKGQK